MAKIRQRAKVQVAGPSLQAQDKRAGLQVQIARDQDDQHAQQIGDCPIIADGAERTAKLYPHRATTIRHGLGRMPDGYLIMHPGVGQWPVRCLALDKDKISLMPEYRRQRGMQWRVSGEWSPTRVGLSATLYEAPDGTLTAAGLQDDGSTNTHFFDGRTRSVASAGDYLIMMAARSAGASIVKLVDTVSSAYAYFDLSDGSILSASGCTAHAEDLGCGWYLCSMLQSIAASGTMVPRVQLTAGVGSDSYAGSSSTRVYAWQPLAERASEIDAKVWVY